MQVWLHWTKAHGRLARKWNTLLPITSWLRVVILTFTIWWLEGVNGWILAKQNIQRSPFHHTTGLKYTHSGIILERHVIWRIHGVTVNGGLMSIYKMELVSGDKRVLNFLTFVFSWGKPQTGNWSDRDLNPGLLDERQRRYPSTTSVVVC